MTKRTVLYTTAYKKAIKRYDSATVQEVEHIIEQLANDKKLEPKYKDHKLQGSMKNTRECHIKPDLLLIYQKYEDNQNPPILILKTINLGSHSDLF